MKIKETVERECCQPRDLKPFKGLVTKALNSSRKDLFFCVHCGRIWRETARMDAAGGTEGIRVDDIILDFANIKDGLYTRVIDDDKQKK